jgi:hypothetical protein
MSDTATVGFFALFLMYPIFSTSYFSVDTVVQVFAIIFLFLHGLMISVLLIDFLVLNSSLEKSTLEDVTN